MNQELLLVEDNPDDQILIRAKLQQTEFSAWQVTAASRLSDALDILQVNKPSLILLDLSLPDSMGVDSFNALYRESENVPIIVMTGLSDVNLAKQLLKLGAQDYLVKGDFDNSVLERALTYALERQRLKSEKDHAQERLIESVLKAQDEERNRIAKELHDGVVQSLTVVSLNLKLMKKKLDDIVEPAAAHYEQSMETLTQTIDEIRNISHSLMPKSISERNFDEAIRSMLSDLEKVTDIEIELISNLTADLEPQLKMTAYRIIQELINNAIKHSKANRLMIQLMDYADNLTLMVEDDGVGFDVNSSQSGFGLFSMQSRARALGAQFDLDSRPGHGTNVLIDFPK